MSFIKKIKTKAGLYQKKFGLDLESREKRLDSQLAKEKKKASLRAKEKELNKIKQSYRPKAPTGGDIFGGDALGGYSFDPFKSQEPKKKKKNDDFFPGFGL